MHQPPPLTPRRQDERANKSADLCVTRYCSIPKSSPALETGSGLLRSLLPSAIDRRDRSIESSSSCMHHASRESSRSAGMMRERERSKVWDRLTHPQTAHSSHLTSHITTAHTVPHSHLILIIMDKFYASQLGVRGALWACTLHIYQK